MKTIIIKKINLIVEDYNNGETITIESENGSGLYYGTNQNGEDIRLTRSELKKLADVDKIDETLEKINNMDAEKIYTDDMINFISENELKGLSKEWQEDYEKVKFVLE